MHTKSDVTLKLNTTIIKKQRSVFGMYTEVGTTKRISERQ